jgi:hypothetical protein
MPQCHILCCTVSEGQDDPPHLHMGGGAQDIGGWCPGHNEALLKKQDI